MDRNTILGLVLMFGIIIGFSVWMSPSKEEKAARQYQRDSIVRVQQQMQDSLKKLAAGRQVRPDTLVKADSGVSKDTIATTPAKDMFGSFSEAASGEEKFYTIENEKLIITLSNKGGGIRKVEVKNYKTFDKLPLVLFQADTALVGFTFFSNNRDLKTQDLLFQPFLNGKPGLGSSTKISGNDSATVSMRLYPDTEDSLSDLNQYMEFVYTLSGNDYMSGFDVRIVGMKDVLASNMTYLNLDWRMHLMQQEKSLKNEQNTSTIYYKYAKDEVDYLSETKFQTKSLVNKVKWISFKQQFFCSTLIADDAFSAADIQTYETTDTSRYVKSMFASIGVPVNLDAKETVIPMKWYFGPTKYKIFRGYKLDLERQIPLGWSFFLMAWINKYAVIPVFDFLSGFKLNYGIIILILTILLKIILFPIAYKTYMSSAKMKVLKPEVEEINTKYPKKEDALKKQQATMDLYKKAGINPMSGCVPMLLQMPILIAMFRFFPSSIELRQQPFLWATDLSSYDSIMDLPFDIPFYGDHVSLFTLLMTISTIFYTKISNDMMATGSQQMPGMKTMMYLMPIMFLGFFNSYSSGLSYYYLLANLFTFAQMFVIRRLVDEKKIHAQIQLNKKKPVKKSNWQKRLEEMANKKGYPARR